MKKLIIFLFALVAMNIANAQGCLPEGITFTSQVQIDSFQYNYPGCIEIEGNVFIGGIFSNITNLLGLNVLTSIGGDLSLVFVEEMSDFAGLENISNIGGSLTLEYVMDMSDLAGLENISNIGGSLSILNNFALTSLSGIENLNSIPGNLIIAENDVLTSLTGAENLTSIGGCLRIEGNDSLENMTGLNALTFVGDCISILDNSKLNSLAALDNLSSVSGGLIIEDNDALTSLSGLDNINAASIDYLKINNNNSLSDCEVQSICNYLADPNGTVDIFFNAPGCDYPYEIANNCGISLPCLPYGNYYFLAQADIDNFQTNYPACDELEGNVNIAGNDINNFDGLHEVNSISGGLQIGDYNWSLGGNPMLKSLSGLENLTHIGGDLRLSFNDSLTSLSGLDNLTSLGGSLVIGMTGGGTTAIRIMEALTSISALSNLTAIPGELYIASTSLTSLTGLDNVTSLGGSFGLYSNNLLTSISSLNNLLSINGRIDILYNSNLTSLSGIDNINASSISYLWLTHNNMLSVCDVKSICDYLALPVINTWIYENASGCDSLKEIEEACLSTVLEIKTRNGISIIPNPAKDKITISSSAMTGNINLSIFNVSGEKVIESQLKDNENQIDISALPRGVYFVQIQNEKTLETGKIIKE